MIIFSVIMPSSPILKKDCLNSELLTEALFGEKLVVLETSKNYSYVRLLNDHYCGWMNSDHISSLIEPSHRVINTRSLVYNNANIKANYICYLPMGSFVKVKKIEQQWANIKLFNNHEDVSAYILKKDLVPINNKKSDWVKYAEKLINTPYKWGGKDTIGIDCSALVQLSTQTAGINFPRDTSDQVNFLQQSQIQLESCKRGSLVFWRGHVAIFVNKKSIIHANGYHMSTVIENFSDANSRITEVYGNVIKCFDILD